MWGKTPELGTPLHLAVHTQSEALVALLLQAGSSPFLVHPGGDSTPLDAAGQAGDPRIVRRLETLGECPLSLVGCASH